MAKTGLVIKMHVENLRPTLKVVAALPAAATRELKDAATDLARELAVKVRADVERDAAPQSPLVASTVKARRDRVPVIEAGGLTPLGERGAPAYKLLFGALFGSDRYSQFWRPHAGTAAYTFFPTVDREQASIAARWAEAADQVVDKFSRG
jgi:hypothetical protein